jgi:hypothetical protein
VRLACTGEPPIQPVNQDRGQHDLDRGTRQEGQHAGGQRFISVSCPLRSREPVDAPRGGAPDDTVGIRVAQATARYDHDVDPEARYNQKRIGGTVSGQNVMLLDSLHAKRDAIENAGKEFGARRIRPVSKGWQVYAKHAS